MNARNRRTKHSCTMNGEEKKRRKRRLSLSNSKRWRARPSGPVVSLCSSDEEGNVTRIPPHTLLLQKQPPTIHPVTCQVAMQETNQHGTSDVLLSDCNDALLVNQKRSLESSFAITTEAHQSCCVSRTESLGKKTDLGKDCGVVAEQIQSGRIFFSATGKGVSITVDSTPPNISSTVDSTPPNISSTVDSTPNISSTVDSTPPNISSTVDSTPPNISSTVDSTPPNISSTVDSTPNISSTVDSTPPNISSTVDSISPSISRATDTTLNVISNPDETDQSLNDYKFDPHNAYREHLIEVISSIALNQPLQSIFSEKEERHANALLSGLISKDGLNLCARLLHRKGPWFLLDDVGRYFRDASDIELNNKENKEHMEAKREDVASMEPDMSPIGDRDDSSVNTFKTMKCGSPKEGGDIDATQTGTGSPILSGKSTRVHSKSGNSSSMSRLASVDCLARIEKSNSNCDIKKQNSATNTSIHVPNKTNARIEPSTTTTTTHSEKDESYTVAQLHQLKDAIHSLERAGILVVFKDTKLNRSQSSSAAQSANEIALEVAAACLNLPDVKVLHKVLGGNTRKKLKRKEMLQRIAMLSTKQKTVFGRPIPVDRHLSAILRKRSLAVAMEIESPGEVPLALKFSPIALDLFRRAFMLYYCASGITVLPFVSLVSLTSQESGPSWTSTSDSTKKCSKLLAVELLDAPSSGLPGLLVRFRKQSYQVNVELNTMTVSRWPFNTLDVLQQFELTMLLEARVERLSEMSAGSESHWDSSSCLKNCQHELESAGLPRLQQVTRQGFRNVLLFVTHSEFCSTLQRIGIVCSMFLSELVNTQDESSCDYLMKGIRSPLFALSKVIIKTIPYFEAKKMYKVAVELILLVLEHTPFCSGQSNASVDHVVSCVDVDTKGNSSYDAAMTTSASNDAAAMTTSNDAAAMTTSNDAAAMTTSNDAAAMTTSNDTAAMTTSNDAAAMTTSNDAAAMTTSNDAAAMTTSNDAAAMTTSNDAAAMATSNDAAAMATSNDAAAMTIANKVANVRVKVKDNPAEPTQESCTEPSVSEIGAVSFAPRRGPLWNRLVINLTHLKQHSDAYQHGQRGLMDPALLYDGASRIALRRRVLRLAKKVKSLDSLNNGRNTRNASTEEMCHTSTISISHEFSELWITVPPAKLVEQVPTEVIQGRPVTVEASVKSRFFTYEDTVEMTCSVECLAMSYYGRTEGWQGVHCEGFVIRALYALCMWDVIFDTEVPGAFTGNYQNAPWDLKLVDGSFYENRKAKIEAILHQLDCASPIQVAEIIAQSWSAHFGVQVTGVSWDRLNIKMMQVCAACIGGKSLSRIFRVLCQGYPLWGSGVPDLMLVKVIAKCPGTDSLESNIVKFPFLFHAKGSGEDMDIAGRVSESDQESYCLEDMNNWTSFHCKIVEVKGPRDTLSDSQILWLNVLRRSGVDAVVLKVVEEPTKSKVVEHLVVEDEAIVISDDDFIN